jgi:AcrR family transcriptional regulator
VSEPLTETRPEPDRATRSRGRILEAARAEFAANGFGGGRVERVAAGAGINKERIYAYFGDKRGLFVAAVASAVQEVGETVGIEHDDLAAFAGGLFDFMAAHPETLRLLTWARLEANEQMSDAAERLIDLPRPEHAIARWQAEGRVSSRWDPRDLVAFVWGLCESTHMQPFHPVGPDAASIEQRRRALVLHAVELLTHEENGPADAGERGGPR